MNTRTFALGLCLGLAASIGCSMQTEDESGAITEQGPNGGDHLGKADDGSDANSTVATCNDGAMILKSGPQENEFTAIIEDQGVVDYFIAESKKVHTDESGTVEKSFPTYVTVEEEDGVKRLIIRDFRVYDDGDRYATSGPPGTTIERTGDGMRLTIRGAKMPSSHSVVYYEIGNWYFESCSKPATEPAPPEPATVSCDDNAIVVDADEQEGFFVATIRDQGVIDYFVSESQKTHTDQGWTVEKEFPWYVEVVDGSEGRRMIIRDFRWYADQSEYSTSDPAATLAREGEGMRLTMRGMKLPSSHAAVRYEIGDWFFQSCE